MNLINLSVSSQKHYLKNRQIRIRKLIFTEAVTKSEFIHILSSEHKEVLLGQNTVPVTDSSFEQEVLKSNTPVLVDFWAEWCGPCKAIGPKLEEIAGEMSSQVKVVKVDVDSNQESAAKFGIRSIPTMILFKGGKPVDQIMGNQPKENIISFISKHL